MNAFHMGNGLIVLLCIALLLLFYTVSVLAEEITWENHDTRFNQHEIFQNLYAQQKSLTVPVYGIKESVKKLKNLLHFSLQNNVTLKITTVKSGPLKQHLTQMVELGPGFKTHEGLIGETSKGYGIKFMVEFD